MPAAFPSFIVSIAATYLNLLGPHKLPDSFGYPDQSPSLLSLVTPADSQLETSLCSIDYLSLIHIYMTKSSLASKHDKVDIPKGRPFRVLPPWNLRER